MRTCAVPIIKNDFLLKLLCFFVCFIVNYINDDIMVDDVKPTFATTLVVFSSGSDSSGAPFRPRGAVFGSRVLAGGFAAISVVELKKWCLSYHLNFSIFYDIL